MTTSSARAAQVGAPQTPQSLPGSESMTACSRPSFSMAWPMSASSLMPGRAANGRAARGTAPGVRGCGPRRRRSLAPSGARPRGGPRRAGASRSSRPRTCRGRRRSRRRAGRPRSASSTAMHVARAGDGEECVGAVPAVGRGGRGRRRARRPPGAPCAAAAAGAVPPASLAITAWRTTSGVRYSVLRSRRPRGARRGAGREQRRALAGAGDHVGGGPACAGGLHRFPGRVEGGQVWHQRGEAQLDEVDRGRAGGRDHGARRRRRRSASPAAVAACAAARAQRLLRRAPRSARRRSPASRSAASTCAGG